MKPKIGKWYIYKFRDEVYWSKDSETYNVSYNYDIFRVDSINDDFYDKKYVIRQHSIFRNFQVWHVTYEFWDKWVKEIKEEEIKDIIMVNEL